MAPAVSLGSTLTTTGRRRDSSVATKTRLIPPPPSSRSMVYARPSVLWSSTRRSLIGGTEAAVAHERTTLRHHRLPTQQSLTCQNRLVELCDEQGIATA